MSDSEVALPSRPGRRRRKTWIARHWRGEYPLGVSYWGMGILGGLIVGVASVIFVSALPIQSGYNPLRIFAILVATWVATALITTWQLVGIWRSANHRIEARARIGRKALWASLAKIAVFVGFMRLLGSLISQGAPQVVEGYRMAFMDDPEIPAYAIRVMRNGTEAEITGGFKYGLSDDFLRVVRASPRIRVLHLNSLGGRVGEAEKLNGLIREKGLITYVSAQCVSACTAAFAGGRERWIKRGASLGFHAPTFPGMTAADLSAMSRVQRTLFLQAGFATSLVDRAMATPNDQVWTPTLDELRSSRVVTAVSDGTQFAASGYGANATRAEIAKNASQNVPVLQAIQERLPTEFARIMDDFYKGYEDGASEAELAAAAHARIVPIYAAYARLADDQTLVDLGKLLVDQYAVLSARDPESCYLYASGSGGARNFSLEMPAALVERELAIGARIIRTAAERPDITDQVTGPLWAKVVADLQGSLVLQLSLVASDSSYLWV